MDGIIRLAKLDDVRALREAIADQDEWAVKLKLNRVEMTLQNAQLLLAKGLKRQPAMWSITLDELPELWAEYILNEDEGYEAVKLAA